jgi:phosphoribosylformylglycinamidine (FGAM) synthase-like enzyme
MKFETCINEENNTFVNIDEVSMSCNKKEIKKLAEFFNSCLKDVEKGTFNILNGGHRHFKDFKTTLEEFKETKTDLILFISEET